VSEWISGGNDWTQHLMFWKKEFSRTKYIILQPNTPETGTHHSLPHSLTHSLAARVALFATTQTTALPLSLLLALRNFDSPPPTPSSLTHFLTPSLSTALPNERPCLPPPLPHSLTVPVPGLAGLAGSVAAARSRLWRRGGGGLPLLPAGALPR
jgi:hypothetical protein